MGLQGNPRAAEPGGTAWPLAVGTDRTDDPAQHAKCRMSTRRSLCRRLTRRTASESGGSRSGCCWQQGRAQPRAAHRSAGAAHSSTRDVGRCGFAPSPVRPGGPRPYSSPAGSMWQTRPKPDRGQRHGNRPLLIRQAHQHWATSSERLDADKNLVNKLLVCPMMESAQISS